MNNPNDHKYIKFLRKLSRRGAVLAPLASGGHGVADLGSAIEGHGKTRAGLRAPAGFFERAQSAGWIERHPNAGVWKISRRGRATLREMPAAGMGFAPATSAEGPERRLPPATGLAAEFIHHGPLNSLRRRKNQHGQPFLAESELKAGELLKTDYLKANASPGTTVNWAAGSSERSQHSRENGFAERLDSTIAARQRLERALERVGTDIAPLLIAICCHERGLAEVEKEAALPQRSLKHFVLVGLRILAAHYGLSSRGGLSQREQG